MQEPEMQFASPLQTQLPAMFAEPAADHPTKPLREPRYLFIDALRGLAACAVVIAHLGFTPMTPKIQEMGLSWLTKASYFGTLGVEVFFVISGFVIISSLHNIELTWRSFLRFAVRRQIRLDPPYWTTVLICFGLGMIAGRAAYIFHPVRLPGLVINLLYLHRVLGRESILPVSWTLCIEIQFYTMAAILLWLCQTKRTPGAVSLPVILVFFLTGGCSAAYRVFTETHNWFGPFWSYFALGALAWWSLRSRWALATFVALVVLVLATTNRTFNAPGGYVGAITASIICGLGQRGLLAKISLGAAVQFFGRISYSLYLVHFAVLQVVLDGGYHLTRGRPLPMVFWFLLAVTASISVACLLHRYIEKPSMMLAHSIKKPVAITKIS